MNQLAFSFWSALTHSCARHQFSLSRAENKLRHPPKRCALENWVAHASRDRRIAYLSPWRWEVSKIARRHLPARVAGPIFLSKNTPTLTMTYSTSGQIRRSLARRSAARILSRPLAAYASRLAPPPLRRFLHNLHIILCTLMDFQKWKNPIAAACALSHHRGS